MAALKNQWQAARQLRQDEVIKRRQQVASELTHWQQTRLADAAQLRQSLNQLYTQLQDETDLWLIQARQQRVVQAERLRQSLQDYVQLLQREMAEKIHVLQEHRITVAQHLRSHLAMDHRDLRDAVSDLRLELLQDLQQLQRRVQDLQQDTAVMRAGHRQQQAMLRSQFLPELTAYVDTLQDEVATFLAELTQTRQQAAALQQQQRQVDRQILADEVDALFDELASFRQELKAFRNQLTTSIWGEETEAGAVPRAMVSRPGQAQRSAPVALPDASKQRPVAKAPPASKPLVKMPVPVLQRPQSSNPRTTSVAAPQATATTSVAAKPALPTPSSAPAVPQSPAQNVEESVYNYLHNAQGARLTEIESELGINRFQAVDALRALIQKELIIQEDRIYHVQEEAVL